MPMKDQHNLTASISLTRRVLGKILLSLPIDLGHLFQLKMHRHGYLLHIRKSTISLEFFRNPNARLGDHQFITDYLRSADIYVDVGANIGTMLIPALQMIGAGHALAFEPHPTVYRYLLENLQLNGLEQKADLYNYALGSRSQKIGLTSYDTDDTNQVVDDSELMVQMRMLDEFTARFDEINLLKIDVEGYEKFVVEGADETLQKTHCVYFEVGENLLKYGYRTRDLLETFEALNLSVCERSSVTQIRRVDSTYEPPKKNGNLIAIRDLDDFLDRTGWNFLE